MPWQPFVEAIRTDKSSGSAEIAGKAAVAVLTWLRQSASTPFPAWQAELMRFAPALYSAQPSMAALFNLANDILLALEATASEMEARQQVRGAAERFLQQLEDSQGQLVTTALSLLPPAAQILTFSYSSSVLAVLLAAARRDDALAVICTEGRPLLEGRQLAQRLAAAGITARFGVDAAVSSLMHQASLALVGADSITHEGVVNKLGTTGVALAARHAGVPCYVLCGRQKWLPREARRPDPYHAMPAAEVWPGAPASVQIRNAYFECTPIALFSSIIDEQGPLTPEALLQYLDRMPVACAWQEAATAPHP